MTSIFPKLRREDILEFQFSSWYPRFKSISIKSTVISPLSDEFCRYLRSDGVFVPHGSENNPARSSLSDVEEGEEDGPHSDGDPEGEENNFAFPELDGQIRACILQYGAVFPKLNFSSPKDAAWVLPASSPLKCTSPADVYLLLKSSDFISSDVSSEAVFEGCEAGDSPPSYQLELVLRKWYSMDPSREFRCFVRQGTLLGISQRDTNFYDFLVEQEMQLKITAAITSLWTEHINGRWPTADYTFDVFLTRNFETGHILDFNLYAPRTDPLLFTYDALDILRDSNDGLPLLKVVESQLAASSAPNHVHNMVPLELISLSAGKTLEDFTRDFQDEIAQSVCYAE